VKSILTWHDDKQLCKENDNEQQDKEDLCPVILS